MNLLIYNWRDIKNPAAGGAEVVTHEIAKRLVLKGHKITLFTAAFPGCKEIETIDGVEIIRSGGRFTVYLKAPQFVNDGTPFIALIHQLAREFWFHETPFPINLLNN